MRLSEPNFAQRAIRQHSPVQTTPRERPKLGDPPKISKNRNHSKGKPNLGTPQNKKPLNKSQKTERGKPETSRETETPTIFAETFGGPQPSSPRLRTLGLALALGGGGPLALALRRPGRGFDSRGRGSRNLRSSPKGSRDLGIKPKPNSKGQGKVFFKAKKHGTRGEGSFSSKQNNGTEENNTKSFTLEAWHMFNIQAFVVGRLETCTGSQN